MSLVMPVRAWISPGMLRSGFTSEDHSSTSTPSSTRTMATSVMRSAVGELQQRLGAVRAHVAADLDVAHAVRGPEWPAAKRCGIADAEAIVLQQVLGAFRRAEPLQVRRGGADDALEIADLARHER